MTSLLDRIEALAGRVEAWHARRARKIAVQSRKRGRGLEPFVVLDEAQGFLSDDTAGEEVTPAGPDAPPDALGAPGVGDVVERESPAPPAGDLEEGVCRVCGCTDDEACEGGCEWVADPLGLGDCVYCSACLREACAVQAFVAATVEAERVISAAVDRVRPDVPYWGTH